MYCLVLFGFGLDWFGLVWFGFVLVWFWFGLVLVWFGFGFGLFWFGLVWFVLFVLFGLDCVVEGLGFVLQIE